MTDTTPTELRDAARDYAARLRSVDVEATSEMKEAARARLREINSNGSMDAVACAKEIEALCNTEIVSVEELVATKMVSADLLVQWSTPEGLPTGTAKNRLVALVYEAWIQALDSKTQIIVARTD